jgi:NAD(P)-dependent dehydrogenase (short-subunit alcohol dehydrogenase family)
MPCTGQLAFGMKILKQRVAVVTGAASGIGRAISAAFIDEGMRVVLADRNAAMLAEAVEEFSKQGGEVHGVVADVGDQAEVERIAAETIEHFGVLNVAVNNAGIVNRGYSWELTLEDWQQILNVNLWGVVHGVRSFVPRILASGEEGHVVNVGSMASVLALGQLGPYTVAKHGVLGLSDVLRAEFVELAAPVGVSVVMPGRVKTAMNPIGKFTAAMVAVNVVDAIKNDRPYVFTDNDSVTQVHDRMLAIVNARAEVVRQD